MHDIVFLFDVDNTLLDNDRVQADLSQHLAANYGTHARDRYSALLEELRDSLGYADYLGALQRYRLEELHDPRVLRIANWLMDYAFADRLYPYAMEAVQHANLFGTTVILSDGDAAFQPRKVERSGLWHAFGDDVLIFVHKEECLDDVERLYPAQHYIMVDDKLRILDAVKQYLGRPRYHRIPAPGPLRVRPRDPRRPSSRRHHHRADRRPDALRPRRARSCRQHSGTSLPGDRPSPRRHSMRAAAHRPEQGMTPHMLTLVAAGAGPPLSPAIITRVRNATGGGEAIDLSPGEAADIPLDAAPDMAAVRAALDGAPVDAILTALAGRRKSLLVADMDSTIVTGETLDELADFAGLKQRIAAITARAMNGELDFKAALRERVAMLRGLPIGALENTWQRVRLTPGARELVATMRAHGAYAALVSGGFTFFTGRVAEAVGFDTHRSNVLLDDGATLTGFVAEPILDRDAKLDTLTRLAAERGLPLSATLAVGDGANDLDMLRAAGLGVAFRAKPIVAAEARARVDHADLRALLFAQGYRREDIVGAG